MFIKLVQSLVTVLGALLLLQCPAFARCGTDHIASAKDVVCGPSFSAVVTQYEDGKQITTTATPWPEGVLEVVNHPLRTDGWHTWFSGLLNDIDRFDLEIRFPRDVDHVVQKFAAIKAPSLWLELRQTKAKWTTQMKGSRPIGAEFSIGNQAIVNHWFKHLPVEKSGARIFGAHRYTKPPTACPPTLTLYAGHAAVNLSKLSVPLNVDVMALVGDANSADHEEAEMLRAIDQFVAAHKAKQKAARKSGAGKK